MQVFALLVLGGLGRRLLRVHRFAGVEELGEAHQELQVHVAGEALHDPPIWLLLLLLGLLAQIVPLDRLDQDDLPIAA